MITTGGYRAGGVRPNIEAMPPAAYLAASLLRAVGVLGGARARARQHADDRRDRRAHRTSGRCRADRQPQPRGVARPRSDVAIRRTHRRGRGTLRRRPAGAPCRRMAPAHHHRCPRYVRGVTGTVTPMHGGWPLPETLGRRYPRRSTRVRSRCATSGATTPSPARSSSTSGRATWNERATMSRRPRSRHHPSPLTEVEQRVAAIESLLVERGLVTTDAIDAVVRGLRARPRPDERREGRRPRVGRPRRTVLGCSTTPPLRSPSSGSAAPRASTSSCWRTPRTSTTSSCAPCAPATRGRCSGCRRAGTRARSTGRASCGSRERSSPSSARSSATTSRCGCGTRAPRSATSSLPLAPESVDGRPEDELATLVTRDHMIGVVR